ncbi:MAG: DUF5666 domain-containing protein [Proteobacteria bacterium]|nr:DUF5666 domain-containing protein [Pseudomonadota bacterium]
MKINKYICAIMMVVFATGLYAAPLAPDIVVIDDQRSLELSTSTAVTLDRRPLVAARALEQGGTGLMVQTLAGYNARLVYTSGETPIGGELSNLDLLNSLVGPVTTNDEAQSQIDFAVLLAPVVIDGDTVVVGADSISEIAVGSIVAVSGRQAQNGAVATTRIEVLDSDFPYWVLTGDIMNLSADDFSIGDQNINRDANTVIDCGDVALDNGLKVIVELTPKSDYTVGDSLDSTSIICYTAFDDPPIGGGDFVFFSGEISFVNDALNQITIDGINVNLDENTYLINGVLENLAIGVEVEVAGILDDNTGEVTASAIRFLVDLYSAGAPIAPEDITLSEPDATNGVLNIMVLAVQQNTLTYDPFGIFVNGIAEETSLAFVGYKDSQGTIWASAVYESRGNPNQGGGGPITFLQATVDSLDGGQLIVAGVNIDPTGGVFFDNENNMISQEDFYASLSVGDRIFINEADSYDKASNTLIGGRYFGLENGSGSPNSASGSQTRSSDNPIGGAGTVTEVIRDLLFVDAF